MIAAGAGRTGVAFALRDDGGEADQVAGDHLHSGRLVPAQHEELATARRVRSAAHVEAGGVDRLVDLDFTYTPRPCSSWSGSRHRRRRQAHRDPRRSRSTSRAPTPSPPTSPPAISQWAG
ncbi:MAG: hypothetical protein HS111_04865 [Kofleriaceae bacterium]|nr:hypothetical protein [Kofleriaceae bacterium]